MVFGDIYVAVFVMHVDVILHVTMSFFDDDVAQCVLCMFTIIEHILICNV